MKEKDIDNCRHAFRGWIDPEYHQRILLLSPSTEQQALVAELLPNAHVVSWSIESYDISAGPPSERFDVAFAANVFMCSQDPALWIKNLLASCDELWVQDLVRAWRDGHREICPETGDYARYSFPSRGELTRIDGFDLESCTECMIDSVIFYDDDGASTGHGFKDCRKFVARLTRRPYEFPRKIVLDEESARDLLEKLESPPEPSAALIESFKKQRKKKDA